MMKEKEEAILLDYEKPELEIIEFQLEESIASSGMTGQSTFCGEEVF